MISKEHLEKFKTLYKQHFNKDISDQEALEKGTKLIRLIGLIYKPITRDEYEAVQKDRKAQAKNE